MIEVPLRHHVYSSLRGYKTLHCSASIPAETRSVLDLLARRFQTAVGRSPVAGFFGLGQGLSCAVRGFPHGVDHAGRPRVCVHSVVFAEADLARLPFFRTTSVPSAIFATDAVELQTVSEQLPGVWQAEPPAPADLPALLRALPGPGLLSALVPLLYDEGRTKYLVGGELLADLDAAALLLPPTRRRRLAYFAGPSAPEGEFPTPCSLFVVERAPQGSESDPEVALADPARGHASNLPPVGRYALYLLDQLRPGGDPAAAAAALALAERHCGGVDFNEYRLSQYLEGFLDLRRHVDAEGEPHQVGKNVEAGMAAAASMARAGCTALAAKLLRSIARSIAPGDEEVKRRIEALGRMEAGAQAEAAARSIQGDLDRRRGDPMSDTI